MLGTELDLVGLSSLEEQLFEFSSACGIELFEFEFELLLSSSPTPVEVAAAAGLLGMVVLLDPKLKPPPSGAVFSELA